MFPDKQMGENSSKCVSVVPHMSRRDGCFHVPCSRSLSDVFFPTTFAGSRCRSLVVKRRGPHLATACVHPALRFGTQLSGRAAVACRVLTDLVSMCRLLQFYTLPRPVTLGLPATSQSPAPAARQAPLPLTSPVASHQSMASLRPHSMSDLGSVLNSGGASSVTPRARCPLGRHAAAATERGAPRTRCPRGTLGGTCASWTA